jgi:hypothetical protein
MPRTKKLFTLFTLFTINIMDIFAFPFLGNAAKVVRRAAVGNSIL